MAHNFSDLVQSAHASDSRQLFSTSDKPTITAQQRQAGEQKRLAAKVSDAELTFGLVCVQITVVC